MHENMHHADIVYTELTKSESLPQVQQSWDHDILEQFFEVGLRHLICIVGFEMLCEACQGSSLQETVTWAESGRPLNTNKHTNQYTNPHKCVNKSVHIRIQILADPCRNSYKDVNTCGKDVDTCWSSWHPFMPMA
jgi:hypothetical protein